MKLTDLRGILQYIPQFREKTFILAIDGAIVTDENFATLLLDVAVLRSLNIRVVLVHGASAQIKSLAPAEFVAWLPVSDAERALKAPVVERDAGAEILLWHVHVVDEMQGSDLQRIVYHYVRAKRERSGLQQKLGVPASIDPPRPLVAIEPPR